MAFHRAKHTSGYTVIDNAPFSMRGGLSLAARGLLATVLTLPEDWAFSVQGLCKIVPDGRRRVSGALSELERAGYIVRSGQERDEAGRVAAQIWDVYESPQVATDAQNVPTGTTRKETESSQAKADAQNVQVGMTCDDAVFSQVATAARLPQAENVPEVIKHKEVLIRNGADDAAARGAASPLCPSCKKPTEHTNSHKHGKRLFRCRECGEEVWEDE